MKVTRFSPNRDLIIVPGRVLGPRGREQSLRFAVDTGAGQTIISPELIDERGYSAREHGDQLAVTRSVVGREEGYMLRVGLPRRWDDSSRKLDKGPHDQLAALFRRLKASLHGWTEALDHLAPTN